MVLFSYRLFVFVSVAFASSAMAESDKRLPFEPEMVRIPGGTFLMGCVSGKDCEDEEKPVRKVTVSAFEMGKYEVTFAQWDICVDDGGCAHKPVDEGWGCGNRPVINVSWDDAQEYMSWLNKKTGKQYRLATEAEWEYAVRGDQAGKNRTKYSWGNAIGRAKANCFGCGSRWDNKKTAPVGQFPANRFGLHDMHGNVWEWVNDWYATKYRKGDQTDPKGPRTGQYRVLRGGSWGIISRYLRSAYRDWLFPDIRFNFVGFRVVRSVPLPQ